MICVYRNMDKLVLPNCIMHVHACVQLYSHVLTAGPHSGTEASPVSSLPGTEASPVRPHSGTCVRSLSGTEASPVRPGACVSSLPGTEASPVWLQLETEASLAALQLGTEASPVWLPLETEASLVGQWPVTSFSVLEVGVTMGLWGTTWLSGSGLPFSGMAFVKMVSSTLSWWPWVRGRETERLLGLDLAVVSAMPRHKLLAWLWSESGSLESVICAKELLV